jgi:hypothetical protein
LRRNRFFRTRSKSFTRQAPVRRSGPCRDAARAWHSLPPLGHA